MSETLKRKLPRLATLLLVVVLAISLAKLIWLIITPEAEAAVVSKKNQSPISAIQKATDYGKLIAAQHVFGEVKIVGIKTDNTPVKPIVKTKPKVKINAKLHGIVAYQSQKGFALISNKNGPQKVYGEKDTLQEGVTITKVLATKVLLDNNGVEEELLLPVKTDGKSSKSSGQDLSYLPGSKSKKPTSASSKSDAADLPDLNEFRKEVLTDPAKLTDIVRASPAIINGKFSGFRVRAGKNRKLFRQLNFRANDIITEVNGVVLDDQSKGLQVLAELETATDLSIKVKRGTQEVYIDHSF